MVANNVTRVHILAVHSRCIPPIPITPQRCVTGLLHRPNCQRLSNVHTTHPTASLAACFLLPRTSLSGGTVQVMVHTDGSTQHQQQHTCCMLQELLHHPTMPILHTNTLIPATCCAVACSAASRLRHAIAAVLHCRRLRKRRHPMRTLATQQV
jgi:hypothetical protein